MGRQVWPASYQLGVALGLGLGLGLGSALVHSGIRFENKLKGCFVRVRIRAKIGTWRLRKVCRYGYSWGFVAGGRFTVRVRVTVTVMVTVTVSEKCLKNANWADSGLGLGLHDSECHREALCSGP